MVAAGAPIAVSLTQKIYGLIKEENFEEVIHLLTVQLEVSPESRAALSLLAYCYYCTEQFENAAKSYARLSELYPDKTEYLINQAQSLHKADQQAEACRIARQIGDLADVTAGLMFAACYAANDIHGCRQQLARYKHGSLARLVNNACLLCKEGDWDQACRKFLEALDLEGKQPDIMYNVALCHYRLKRYGSALKCVAEVIERGVKQHPELNVGRASEVVDALSVGNSLSLKETCVVEALNLRTAIEYVMGNTEAAKEALADLPPRQEEELDAVTIHNSALLQSATDPSSSFRKLTFLLQNPPFPPETFSNLLLLHCKPEHALYDQAADLIADNPQYMVDYLKLELQQFLQATVLRKQSPQDAIKNLEALAAIQVEALRRMIKNVQSARIAMDNAAIKKSIHSYDAALEAYVPVLMSMIGIYWELEQYGTVERILRQSAEFCSEHPTWRLNMAHALFIQGKYEEAQSYYQPIVQQHVGNLLEVTAIALANLCVTHIMLSQNEEAEEIMRRVEKEEETSPKTPCFHFCIINLVIGTLYCSKGNFEFGISRIIKSFDPLPKKLGADTWFYAKRSIIAFLEGLAEHLIIVKDSILYELDHFLEEAEKLGKQIQVSFASSKAAARSIGSEARILRHALHKVQN